MKSDLKIPSNLRVSYFEIGELMAKMIGKQEEYENDEIDDLEEEFYSKFDIDSSQFHYLIEHLMPYTVLSRSELNDNLRIGFVDHENGVYLVKSDI